MLHGNVTFSVLNQASNKLSTIENSDWVANLKSNKAIYVFHRNSVNFFYQNAWNICLNFDQTWQKWGPRYQRPSSLLPFYFHPLRCSHQSKPIMSHVKSHRGSVKQQKKPLQKGHSYDFPIAWTHGSNSSIRQKCATLRLEDHFAFGDCIKRL